MTAINNEVEIPLRVGIQQWLELTRCSGQVGFYRFTAQGVPTFLSSCFAIFIYELVDLLSSIPVAERQSWAAYLRSCQDVKSGLFKDHLLNPCELEDRLHSQEYLEWQMTMFGISALDAIDQHPDHALSFLSHYRNARSLHAWLNKRDLSNPWMMSNEVMFLMFFFSYEYLRGKNSESLRNLKLILDYLDRHQDPRTGFWGTDHGADILNAMAGAYHFLPFYGFFEKPLSYSVQMIDRILALQNRSDGLFVAKGGGGACEDMDAVGSLIILNGFTNHRELDILHALEKAKQTLRKSQKPDGGFSWSLRKPYGIKEWIHAINPFIPYLDVRSIYVLKRSAIGGPLKRNKFMSHAGWQKMRFKIDESDMWSTYFRLLAIALIESRQASGKTITSWKFRTLPGLGWHI